MRTSPWKRRRGRRPAVSLGALFVGGMLASISCRNIKEIPLGVCGNTVLEPDRGEDCDTALIEADTRCQPPGTPNACRYVCIDPASGTTHPCPSGWGCGRDGVCRAHTGTSQPSEAIPTAMGTFLHVADFDGDGLADISWQYADRFAVTHVLAAGTSTVERTVAAVASATVGDANADGRADWLIPTSGGLELFRGAPDRAPRPTMFQSIPLPLGVTDFIPMDLVPDVVLLAAGPTTFAGDESILVHSGLDSIASFNRHVVLTHDADIPPGALLLAADFDETNSNAILPPNSATPDELAVASSDTTELLVYRPSLAADEETVQVSFATLTPATIQLPSPPVRFIGALQLNPAVDGEDGAATCPDGMKVIGDTHLDIVIDVGNELVASYGRGDGTFHSDPCDLRALPSGAEDYVAASLGATSSCCVAPGGHSCQNVLALGHLDDDGSIDVVSTGGAFTTTLAGSTGSPIACTSAPHGGTMQFGGWSQARIADFDGDGHNDVMASALGGGLDFLAGSGGVSLTETHIPAGVVPATHMTLSDLDADGIQDVALADQRADGLTHISVVFGEFLSPPKRAIEIGTVDCLSVLDAFDSGGSIPEEADDLVVVRSLSEGECDPFGPGVARMAGIVEGTPDRQLESTFVQAYGFSEETFYSPFASVLGHFVDAETTDLAMVSLSVGSFVDPARFTWGLGLATIEGDVSFPIVGDGASPIELHAPFANFDALTAVAIDSDADGVDELFVMSSGRTTPDAPVDASSVRLFLATAAADGMWSVAPPVTLEHASAMVVFARSGSVEDAVTPMSCFLDDTDAPSLVLGITERERCADGTQTSRVVLYVLPAAFVAAVGRGERPPLPASAKLVAPNDEQIVAFTCFNGDGDARDELAVLLLGAPQPSCTTDDDGARDDLTARIATLSLVGSEPGELITFATLDGGDAESLRAAAQSPTAPLSGLAAGDVDGDGVDDLVLGAGNATLLLKGEPANR